jgi:hypothetical protein
LTKTFNGQLGFGLFASPRMKFSRARFSDPSKNPPPPIATICGSFAGSLSGSSLGSAAAIGISTVILASNPVGWAAFAIGTVGAAVAGYGGVTAGGDYADYLYQNVKGGIEAANDPLVQKYFDDLLRDISGQTSFDRDLANVGNSYAGLEQQARQQR